MAVISKYNMGENVSTSFKTEVTLVSRHNENILLSIGFVDIDEGKCQKMVQITSHSA